MQKRATKIILYIAFAAMLIMAAYVIFVTTHQISNSYYFYITAAAFLLVCTVFIILLIKNNTSDKKWAKMAAAICIVLVVFQLVMLPVANFFSETLPVYPRGTIYQFPHFSNSIAQNDVGLLMRYYLDGKTLYAQEDYPLNSHNGYIFITDEYEYVKTDYPVLTVSQAEEFYQINKADYQAVNVQVNTKLLLDAFTIYLYTGEESDEMSIVLDEAGSWYVMPKSVCEEYVNG